MADKIILADTSVLMEYFRKTDKNNSTLVSLFDQGYDFAISPFHIMKFILVQPQLNFPFGRSYYNERMF